MTKVDTDIMFKLSITPGVPEAYEIQILLRFSDTCILTITTDIGSRL